MKGSVLIQKMRKIVKAQEALEDKRTSLNLQRSKLQNSLVEEVKSVRIVELTEEIKALRKHITDHRVIQSLLSQHKISLNQVAIVYFITENARRRLFGWNQEKTDYWLLRIDEPNFSWWDVTVNYRFGGPLDPVKVFFRQSKNGKYFISGFLTTFPMELKKKAA